MFFFPPETLGYITIHSIISQKENPQHERCGSLKMSVTNCFLKWGPQLCTNAWLYCVADSPFAMDNPGIRRTRKLSLHFIKLLGPSLVTDESHLFVSSCAV